MNFKIIYWNIWLENQLRGITKTNLLLEELEKIIAKYNPDCIGMNEVLKHSEHEIPHINNFLHKLGYTHNYFSHGRPLDGSWDIGSALCSKYPLHNTEEVELGNNATANKEGNYESKIKAIATEIKISGKKIGIVVAHPINLKPSTIKDHYTHTRNLANFIEKSEYKDNSIIGGDFNEPMHLPGSFKSRTASYLHHKTGSKSNPTWRHNTWRKTPLRANLDRLFWTKDGNLELSKFEIIESHTSDHRPIFASFDIKSDN